MTERTPSLVLEVAGHSWPLHHGDVIGRLGNVGGEVLRAHSVLSRRHLRVTLEGGQWRVTLLPGATNVTLLDGRPLSAGEPEVLAAVSVITVDTLQFRIRALTPTGGEATMPARHPIGLVTLDELLHVRAANDFARDLLGERMEEGVDFTTFFDAHGGIVLRHELAQLATGAETGEIELPSPTSARWFSVRFHREGARLHGVLRDTTEEHLHRESVQAAESRLLARTEALEALLSAPFFREGDLPAALPLLMEHAVAVMGEVRLSVWVEEGQGSFRAVAMSHPGGRQAIGTSVPKPGDMLRAGELGAPQIKALQKAGVVSAAGAEVLVLEARVQLRAEPAAAFIIFEQEHARGWPAPARKLAQLIVSLLQQAFDNSQRSDTLQRLKAQEAASAGELAEASSYIEKRLPQPMAQGPVQVEWVYRPCGRLGGDMLGYEWIDDDHFALYIVDVMGHGSKASLHALSLAQTLRLLLARQGPERGDPAQWLAALNAEFPMKKNQDLLWTMWCGVFNKRTRELRYSSGGHPPALLLLAGACRPLSTDGPVLGALEEAKYQSAVVGVPEAASLFLYTDGVYEFPTAREKAGTLDDFIEAVCGVRNMEHGECAFLQARAAALCLEPEFPDDFTIVRARFAH